MSADWWPVLYLFGRLFRPVGGSSLYLSVNNGNQNLLSTDNICYTVSLTMDDKIVLMALALSVHGLLDEIEEEQAE